MASALSKELGLMESQLTRWKETADEALNLRENAQSLKTLLNEKVTSFYDFMLLLLVFSTKSLFVDH